MKAHDFDTAFDAGEDVSGQLDWPESTRPNLAMKRVNVDFPSWEVDRLDREAQRLGISR